MSRPMTRALTAVAAATMVAASLLGAPAALAGGTITGLTATPTPPSKVVITWDAFTTTFTVDHYVAKLQPGNRTVTNAVTDPDPTSATFSDLSWGTDYTASVTAYGTAPSEVSPSSILQVPGTKLSANISPSNTTRGKTTVIRGTLRNRNDRAIKGATVQVQVKYLPVPPYKFQDLHKVKTNNKGAFVYRFKANSNAEYQVLYAGAKTAGGWDAGMTLAVRVPVSLKFSSNPVSFGRKVKFSGSLGGTPSKVAGASVRLQHKVRSHWKTVQSSTVKATGRYSITYKPTSRDDQAWRVMTTAGDSYATSMSKARVLVVR